MKILVCISKAPDTTAKIKFTDGDTKFDQNGVNYIVNPYDEWYALVRGLELKEASGGTVTAITVGDASNDPIIRKALAIGADDAIRIDAQPTDAFFVAKQLAEQAKAGGYELILTGKETINYNGSQIGAMVAELLDIPFVSVASKLEVTGQNAEVTRDAKGGDEVVSTTLPLVVSAGKGMAEQRIPNMRGIMAAKRKPLNVVAPSDFAAKTQTVKYSLPPAKTGCKYLDANQMDELVSLLHNEAKVI